VSEDGIALIEQQIVEGGRSLLQYVVEAFPYRTAKGEPAWHRIETLAREQQEAVGRLIRYLHRHHVTPPLFGAFPSGFTTINFVALEHLLPALQKDQQLSIAALEKALAGLPESAERHLLWDHLQMKRRHLQTLQEIGQAEAVAH
jgi:hypothetical protein